MPKRSSTKRPRDLNSLAHQLVGESTGTQKPKSKHEEKNAAAVELGRLGGLKGGAARAKTLTKDQRREIARLAAEVRWKKSKS